MSFTTSDFLLFFLLVWCLQRVLPHRQRNWLLLAVSYFFYACWDWRFLGLIFLSTLIDFTAGQQIAQTLNNSIRNRWLLISSAVNLGILGFFKYANFGISSAEQLLSSLGVKTGHAELQIILPVGISFYTFQTLSYVIDVYRGKLRPLERLDDYALYLAFFPQLVAGPIERGESLAPQMVRKRLASWQDIRFGCWLCCKGVFKKAVIADNLAPIVDGVFNQDRNPTGPLILLAVYAFAFQIYGDFSGYSDIARGTAKMMGYDLMVNFRLPYLAQSPSEFWQRWHISLSSWLRDYLYIPLGGNRQGTYQTYRNLMLTMLLGGLWHGAAWTFVIWGAWHGVLLIGQRLMSGSISSATTVLQIWTRRTILFHLVCVGWIFFRANTLGQAITFLRKLPTGWNWSLEVSQLSWQISLLCGPLLIWHVLQEQLKDLNLAINLTAFPRAVIYCVMALMILALGQFGGREFIYFQF